MCKNVCPLSFFIFVVTWSSENLFSLGIKIEFHIVASKQTILYFLLFTYLQTVFARTKWVTHFTFSLLFKLNAVFKNFCQPFNISFWNNLEKICNTTIKVKLEIWNKSPWQHRQTLCFYWHGLYCVLLWISKISLHIETCTSIKKSCKRKLLLSMGTWQPIKQT